jgi:hypothetical protein
MVFKSNAQLKVLSTGRVDIYNQHVIKANINTDMLDIVNDKTNVSAGYDLIWANYSYTQPNFPGLLKLATSNVSKFVVRSNGYTGIGITNPGYTLHVVGDANICGTFFQSSDERLKDNIQTINNSVPNLFKLSGIKYNFKTTPEDLYFEGKSSLYEKDTILIRKNVYEDDFYTRIHFGFSAQNVKEYFPEMVSEDSLGLLSVDYIGFIPLIVEALKSQEQRITTYDSKIAELNTRIIQLEGILSGKKSAFVADDNRISSAVLYQNTPNPFNQRTTIRYYINEIKSNSILYVFNLQGTLMKSYKLNETGEGQIEIHSSELQPGMYLYTLIENGEEIDTKRMILTQ